MRKFTCVFCFLLAIPQGFAQLKMVHFEQIDSLQTIEKRKVIVFIHTDWCKYCQVIKSKTFKNVKLIKEINEHFYFVDFNAEEKRKIDFNKATFEYKPNGVNSGIHELALELGTINGQISYPTLCVLNDKNEIVFQNNSYLNTENLINILEIIKN